MQDDPWGSTHKNNPQKTMKGPRTPCTNDRVRQIADVLRSTKKPAVIERTLLLMRVIHTRDETQARWGGGGGGGGGGDAPSLIDLRQTEISSNLFHGTKQMLLFIPQKLNFCRSL